ncbi:hypothetical protein O6H91_13G101300 [Diphasiastrum complanatum]|uniref:Uncharacterized protein n=1 Tax=Diphasiastrum complanatum TaxID=34168 RepID=A0ACC2BXW4_DIPCM|nr:hypothetical protein O6H91_13G101300 [Diphasiastrum complanatum]
MDSGGGGKEPGIATPFDVDEKFHPSLALIQGSHVSPAAGQPLQLFQAVDHALAGQYEEAKPAADIDTTAVVAVAVAERVQDKTSRLPRWSRHETLVLMEAKRVAEATLKKNREDRKKVGQDDKAREGGSFKGKWIMESKWLLISIFCKQRGVDREANQCRKRWGNLFGDYKRIKEWQRVSGAESFWEMRNDVKKENKLPNSFDSEVFDAMEKLMGRKPGSLPETVSENGRPTSEEVLFSDIEHPVQEEDAAAGVAGGVGSSTPAPDSCEGKSQTHVLGWKKRKQACLVDPNEHKDPLLLLLGHSCKKLVSHVEAQNHMIQLDRAERKEQSDSLLSVLGKLVSTLIKIADKL